MFKKALKVLQEFRNRYILIWEVEIEHSVEQVKFRKGRSSKITFKWGHHSVKPCLEILIWILVRMDWQREDQKQKIVI